MSVPTEPVAEQARLPGKWSGNNTDTPMASTLPGSSPGGGAHDTPGSGFSTSMAYPASPSVGGDRDHPPSTAATTPPTAPTSTGAGGFYNPSAAYSASRYPSAWSRDATPPRGQQLGMAGPRPGSPLSGSNGDAARAPSLARHLAERQQQRRAEWDQEVARWQALAASARGEANGLRAALAETARSPSGTSAGGGGGGGSPMEASNRASLQDARLSNCERECDRILSDMSSLKATLPRQDERWLVLEQRLAKLEASSAAQPQPQAHASAAFQGDQEGFVKDLIEKALAPLRTELHGVEEVVVQRCRRLEDILASVSTRLDERTDALKASDASLKRQIEEVEKALEAQPVAPPGSPPTSPTSSLSMAKLHEIEERIEKLASQMENHSESWQVSIEALTVRIDELQLQEVATTPPPAREGGLADHLPIAELMAECQQASQETQGLRDSIDVIERCVRNMSQDRSNTDDRVADLTQQVEVATRGRDLVEEALQQLQALHRRLESLEAAKSAPPGGGALVEASGREPTELLSRVDALEGEADEVKRVLQENKQSWETFIALTSCLQSKDTLLESRIDTIEQSLEERQSLGLLATTATSGDVDLGSPLSALASERRPSAQFGLPVGARGSSPRAKDESPPSPQQQQQHRQLLEVVRAAKRPSRASSPQQSPREVSEEESQSAPSQSQSQPRASQQQQQQQQTQEVRLQLPQAAAPQAQAQAQAQGEGEVEAATSPFAGSSPSSPLKEEFLAKIGGLEAACERALAGSCAPAAQRGTVAASKQDLRKSIQQLGDLCARASQGSISPEELSTEIQNRIDRIEELCTIALGSDRRAAPQGRASALQDALRLVRGDAPAPAAAPFSPEGAPAPAPSLASSPTGGAASSGGRAEALASDRGLLGVRGIEGGEGEGGEGEVSFEGGLRSPVPDGVLHLPSSVADEDGPAEMELDAVEALTLVPRIAGLVTQLYSIAPQFIDMSEDMEALVAKQEDHSEQIAELRDYIVGTQGDLADLKDRLCKWTDSYQRAP